MYTVIRIENLSKKYQISHKKNERYTALRDVIVQKIKTIGKRNIAKTVEDFWALNDICIEIKQGDRVGIIGRNGAGKSTLLKILSRITQPTFGKISITGRVASLLEVGTGFHPELTGRENIFLNGAILGMTKAEIKKKFDEIVDFAEVEQFLDTPVKRYSSGMYVRLAFAVAANLESEVLIVDEVLAVGDAQFQKKCLGKLGEIGSIGRTVLFVSHNMQAINQLCTRGILLNSGKVIADGTVHDIVAKYLQNAEHSKTYESISSTISNLSVDDAFSLIGIRFYQNNEIVSENVLNGFVLEIEITYLVKKRTSGLRVIIDLYDNEETHLFRSFHDEDNDGIPIMMPGKYISKAVIPKDFLAPIKYYICINVGIHNIRYCIPEGLLRIPIFVEANGRYNRAYLGDTFKGKIAPIIPWSTITI